MRQVCTILNDKIHTCIQKLIESDDTEPFDVSELDIDKFIAEMDPDIWSAVCQLTQPKYTRNQPTEMTHTRKIIRFFCMCALFFCTNSQCSFPIHTVLADAVESNGGSGHLLKILNRLGACVSSDTLLRYHQHRVKQLKKAGITSEYPSTAFTVVPAENLDFLHSYARVYSGNQQLSWHGTTIQAVQPQPSVLTDSSVSNCPGLPDLTAQPELSSNSPVGMQQPELSSDSPVGMQQPELSSNSPVGMQQPEPYSDSPVGMQQPEPYSDSPVGMQQPEPYSDSPVGMQQPESYSNSPDHSTDSGNDSHSLMVISPLSDNPCEDDINASLQSDLENPLEREVNLMRTSAETTANTAVTEPTATHHPGFKDVPKDTPEMQLKVLNTRQPHCKCPPKSLRSPLRKKYQRMGIGTECKQQKPNSPEQDQSTNSRVLSDVPSVGTRKLEDFQADIT